MHFKYPFIYFSGFSIKYSFIILLVMLLFLITEYLYNTDKYKISYSFSKAKTVKVLLAYILLIPFHWWSNFTNNQSDILIKLCNIVLIEGNLKNARKVTRLLSCIEEECDLVRRNILNKEKSSDEISKYLCKVEASKNITIISLVKTIMPEEFEKIQDLY